MLNNPLSVIIVNYHSEKMLPACLDSVLAVASKGTEIILVNNDTVSLDHLKEKSADLKIVDHRRNLGFGAGANLGAKEAKGEILFFLNPDSELISCSLQGVLDVFERDREISIMGSRIVSEDGLIQEWIAGNETGFWDIVRNNLGLSSSRKIWESEKLIPADWVSGGALFARSDIFKKIGGFDENFFMYFEDMDLCLRSRQIGGRVFYCPHFNVKHFGGKSYQSKKKQKKDYYLSQDYYLKKHRPAWEGSTVKFLKGIFF